MWNIKIYVVWYMINLVPPALLPACLPSCACTCSIYIGSQERAYF